MGGARERFGSGGIIVLADNRRLAAQGARDRRLARLEGIDHIHLKEGQPQHHVRKQERGYKPGGNSAERQRPSTQKEWSTCEVTLFQETVRQLSVLVVLT